ncbi:outer membrane protein [Altericroceibacterium endophyticum]|uniref:Outer membrane beta-barrel protein n=1 Tax=Altericroceibacterium endophyticum TaxID=1808508 RepID=A0A6I4SZV3_9SPHN|nr:outer membrane beta-barrel protein [Altericroceibacterium endophyticum]MXO64354.1 outer membrane beta-barrel protein [Altericroceibacterium endophyticum]
MKKGLALIALGSTVAFSAVPAMAQDAQDNFSGPRIEGLVGWDRSQPGSSVDGDSDVGIDGFGYGVGIGYDYATPSGFVVGVEGEVTGSTASTENDTSAYDAFGLGEVETGRDFYAGARVGYAVTPNTLVYAKGGYTNARYNLVASDGTNEFDDHLDLDGWRVGAGVEQALSTNTFAKLEYRYSNYEKGEFDAADLGETDRFDVDSDRHQIMAGFGLRF